MFKRIAVFLLALCLLFSCAWADPIVVKDMYDREITLAEPATRVVALTAADCEILCAIGCEEALVGRGAYCDYPASLERIPVVQSGAETNVEEILALNPQVVFMGDMAQSKDIVEQLTSLGLAVPVSNADTIDGAFTAIRMIGQLMGRSAEAETLISDMQSTFDMVRSACQNTGKTVYFEVSPLQWGLWTAGQGTFMDEIAHMCGLTNAFADVQGWSGISEEQVLSRDPDVIVTITMYYGEGPTPEDEILSRPGWADLKAVKNGQVYRINSDAISRPGPRLKDAALELYHHLTDEENQAE